MPKPALLAAPGQLPAGSPLTGPTAWTPRLDSPPDQKTNVFSMFCRPGRQKPKVFQCFSRFSNETAKTRYKKVGCSKTVVFTMNSITLFKTHQFLNDFCYQKTSVFTSFLKSGPMWELFFFKSISFYNEFGTFMSACFKNIGFYIEFCMSFAQD